MIHKIRIILDAKDNIFRDIEIRGKQTLWNLHLGIKSAFSLQEDELSTFNILKEDGTVLKSVPLEDMSDDGSGEIMSDIYINEVFTEKGSKIHFQYGLLDLWEFFCELVDVYEKKATLNYPITVYRFGNVPLKAPTKVKNSIISESILEDDFTFNKDLSFSSFGDDTNDEYEEEDHFNDSYFDENENSKYY